MFERQAAKAAQPQKSVILPPDPKNNMDGRCGSFRSFGPSFKAASIAGDLVVQNARVRSVGAGGGWVLSHLGKRFI